MAQSTVKINIDVNSTSINELEKELAQINEELKETQVGSQAFKDLASKAQALEGALADVNKQVEGFTAEKKFMAADGAIKAFAGSISGVVGAFGMLGIESEKLGAFEEKAASAIALSMGLKDMAEGYKQIADSEVLAAIKAKLFGTAAKSAIAATGIGLLIVGLATVVEYWDDITAAIGGASAEQEKLLEDQKAGVTAAEDGLKAISEQENVLRLQGKSEKEIIQMKIAQTDEVIAQLTAQLETQKQIKKSQVEAAERNQKITAGIIGFLTAPITLLLGAVDALTYGLEKVGVLEEATSLAEGFTMGVASLLFDPEDVAAEGDAAIEETEKKLNALVNSRAGFQLQVQAIDQSAADKAAADAQKAADDEAKRKEDEAKKAADEAERKKQQKEKEAQELAALEKEIQDATALTEEEQYQLKLQRTAEYYDQLIEQAKKFGLDTVELEKAKNEALEMETKAHQDKEKQKEKDFRQQLVNIAADSAMSLISTLKDLNTIYDKDNEEAAKRSFKRQQALSIVETLISTYSAAQKAYASQFLPVPDPTSPARATIAAALAVASGLAKVAVIKSQKFQSPTSGGAASGGGGSVPQSTSGATPNISFPGGAPVVTPEVSSTVRAYVISGDVRDGQEAEAKINQRRKV